MNAAGERKSPRPGRAARRHPGHDRHTFAVTTAQVHPVFVTRNGRPQSSGVLSDAHLPPALRARKAEVKPGAGGGVAPRQAPRGAETMEIKRGTTWSAWRRARRVCVVDLVRGRGSRSDRHLEFNARGRRR